MNGHAPEKKFAGVMLGRHHDSVKSNVMETHATTFYGLSLELQRVVLARRHYVNTELSESDFFSLAQKLRRLLTRARTLLQSHLCRAEYQILSHQVECVEEFYKDVLNELRVRRR